LSILLRLFLSQCNKEPNVIDFPQMKLGFEPPLPLVVKYTTKNHGGKALDIGCGQGYNSVFVAEKGYAVDAVDGYQPGTMLHDPEEILTKLDWHSLSCRLPIETHPMRIEDFLKQAKAAVYDLIIATHVLHFPTFEGELLYRAVMPHLVRVLKPGGRLICAMLKSKQDKEDAHREMIPDPLGTLISDDELGSFWRPAMQPVHYEPALWDDLRADGTHGKFLYCTYQLVADKT
jgi:SAM-dependent methyltransferase